VGPKLLHHRRSPSYGYDDILRASAASVTALVAPHLVSGLLKGKVTFSNVDLLRRVSRTFVADLLHCSRAAEGLPAPCWGLVA
jgi:hypothetical protein